MYLTYTSRMMECRRDGYEEGISIGLERGLTTGREEGISIGLEQGAYQKALETARSMLSRMIPTNLVVDCTGLPLETVLELKQKL